MILKNTFRTHCGEKACIAHVTYHVQILYLQHTVAEEKPPSMPI